MDELCRLMNRHHLVSFANSVIAFGDDACRDENNDELVALYHETRDVLRKDAISQGIPEYQMKNYLKTTRKRYHKYLHKMKFKGQLFYLEESIRDFREKCELLNIKGYTFSAHEFRYLMLLIHFIHSEILTAIGVLSLDT